MIVLLDDIHRSAVPVDFARVVARVVEDGARAVIF
jgi:hypothetical protein